MSGTLALAKAEISRLRRNKRYLIFTVALPVMFYLVFGKSKTTGYGVSFAAFYMVGMAAFGAFSGAFNNNTIRISQERKDGWIRQLRLTPLPANSYVVAKILASMVTTVPSIVIVFLLGRFYGGVQLPTWKWIVCALAIWVGTLIFAALAVALGYKLDPDSVQPVTIVVFFFFSIFGGLWFPLQRCAAEVRRVHAHLPGRQDHHGRDRPGNRGPGQRGRHRGLVRDLRRAGHLRGPLHGRDGLSQPRDETDPASATGAWPGPGGTTGRAGTGTPRWRTGGNVAAWI